MVRVQVPRSAELSEFCIDADCVDAGSINPVVVLDSDEPATHTCRLIVILGDDRERVIEGEVTTEEYSANGRGCDPRTANATLIVREDGSVDETHP